MKRFEFKLERVLHFKQQREKMAEVQQKKAAAALKTVEDEIAVLQDRLAETAAVLESRAAGAPELATWLACYAQAGRIGKALEAAEARAQKARRYLLEANAQRRQAAIEAEGILTLRRQQWQVHQKLRRREEQERGDELALRRWQASRDDAAAEAGNEGIVS